MRTWLACAALCTLLLGLLPAQALAATELSPGQRRIAEFLARQYERNRGPLSPVLRRGLFLSPPVNVRRPARAGSFDEPVGASVSTPLVLLSIVSGGGLGLAAATRRRRRVS
jgi:hypothetical protein